MVRLVAVRAAVAKDKTAASEIECAGGQVEEESAFYQPENARAGAKVYVRKRCFTKPRNSSVADRNCTG